ncbi:MAG: hypothetical protein O7A69_04440 [SAR324 cluster bacterium]|nr:hypothetical protein [SAR324 cluster bacterium]
MDRIKWAAARLTFHAYIAFSLLSVAGGLLTAPIMTWYFFGDWRFWRHFSVGWKLFCHGWKMVALILRGDNNGFMLSVPLTIPPAKAPDKAIVHIAPSWEHGASCGSCTRCCKEIGCPVLDQESGLCRGYDSFFWRYFNCGRFPTIQPEIDYYGCPKWLMNPEPVFAPAQAATEAQPAGATE